VSAWFLTQENSYQAKVRDRRVYAEIRLNAEGVAELIGLSDEPPAEALYLRGRATAIRGEMIDVRFGVEAFFMQQGKAKEFEDEVRGEKAGVSLNMRVALGSNGLAVLEGYRWEPLGITVVLDPPLPASEGAVRTQRRGVRGLTIEVKNHGSTPQAIVGGLGAHNYRLRPATESLPLAPGERFQWVGENTPAGRPASDQMVLLQPQQSHRVHIDLTSEEWFIRKINAKKGEKPATSIEALVDDWSASFRIEYEPPRETHSAGLPHAEYIRRVALRSRAFSAAGGVD
jgi:hypothetical protein